MSLVLIFAPFFDLGRCIDVTNEQEFTPSFYDITAECFKKM
jgi:hypothetical protein